MSNPIERLTNSVIGGDSKKAALIVSETNLYYLTAFPSTDGALLLTSEQAYYLLDFRYTEAARAKAQNVEVVEFTSLNETYKTLLKKHGITEVYMEYAALPYGHAKRFEQLSEECGAKAILNTTLDDAIRKQRIVKSDEEVKRICDAQAITDATFEHILPYIKEGVTEREIALEIEFFMRKEGADGNAFNPIVVTGANGSQCHGIPGNTQIKKGDLITMDTGAMLAGYHSDMTRTVALGHATEEMRKVYDTVLRAQLAGIAASHAGASGKSIDGAAR
ncbi:M24 family metallopeptidase, partial [Hominenteromicrobium sp.]|uniref:M24 family metallopeptidase n=1 Tax=Hominenteromicrobium sp. TaxID=3073581 RepID=UPI003AB134FA